MRTPLFKAINLLILVHLGKCAILHVPQSSGPSKDTIQLIEDQIASVNENLTVSQIIGDSKLLLTSSGYPPMSDEVPECLALGKLYSSFGVPVEGCYLRQETVGTKQYSKLYWRITSCGTWNAQNIRCYVGGGHLASFPSHRDRMFLSNYYMNNGYIESKPACGYFIDWDWRGAWIGLKGSYGSNNWVWQDGTRQDRRYLPFNLISTWRGKGQTVSDGDCGLAAYTPVAYSNYAQSMTGFRQANCINTPAEAICMKNV